MYDLRRIYAVKQHYEHTLKISECKANYYHVHSHIQKGKRVIRKDYLINGVYTNPYESDDEYVSYSEIYIRNKCVMTMDEIDEANYGMYWWGCIKLLFYPADGSFNERLILKDIYIF